jgi:hypothetical protein
MTLNRTASMVTSPRARQSTMVVIALLALLTGLGEATSAGIDLGVDLSGVSDPGVSGCNRCAGGASHPVAADDADRAWIAEIDLGVDVSGVLKSQGAVRVFLAGLDARIERAILNACEHYIEAPDAIIGPDTLTFCSFAIAR